MLSTNYLSRFKKELLRANSMKEYQSGALKFKDDKEKQLRREVDRAKNRLEVHELSQKLLKEGKLLHGK